jgi:hypothetical protein
LSRRTQSRRRLSNAHSKSSSSTPLLYNKVA